MIIILFSIVDLIIHCSLLINSSWSINENLVLRCLITTTGIICHTVMKLVSLVLLFSFMASIYVKGRVIITAVNTAVS